MKKSVLFILIALLSINCNEYRRLKYFMDMAYSPAILPQRIDTFGNRIGNFIPPEGTIPYKADYQYIVDVKGAMEHGWLVEDGEMYDWNLNEGSKKAENLTSPIPVNADTLARGKEKYRIYCSPCHGISGKGDGLVKTGLKAGALPVYPQVLPLVRVDMKKPSRAETWPTGRIYHALTVGINTMGGYASQIPNRNDRWSVAHYVKKLQEEALK
ncbi:MAG: c-type cytochrome [Spirochaetia bacterium]|nr:c-type cytochrome [Spirochaetia bacterium]